MLIRLALCSVVLALNIPGCKKSASNAGSGAPAPSASPSATALAAASPTPVPTPAKPAVDHNAQVVIYGYHRFEKTVRRPDTEMTPEMFESQMKELKDKNIPVIGMQDFLAWKRGEKNIPPRAAIITFDDGWKSQYEVGWPILKKYGYPVTLFIYTEGVRGGKFGGGAAMSWEQLAEMRDAGVDIQAHSATHQDLRKPYDKTLKKKLSPEEYEEFLQREIIGAKQLLESKLAIKVNGFAVPFGYVNDQVREYIIKAGYEAVFTVYGQPITYGTPMNSLGRYLMEGNKPKVFSDALNFGGAASGGSMPVAEISKSDVQAQPADGETITTALPLIRANLASFGQIDEKTIQLRISGLGLVPHSYDPKTQTVSYQVTQKLRDNTCTVIVSARAAGDKKVETSWTFNINDAGAPAASSPAR